MSSEGVWVLFRDVCVGVLFNPHVATYVLHIMSTGGQSHNKQSTMCSNLRRHTDVFILSENVNKALLLSNRCDRNCVVNFIFTFIVYLVVILLFL